MAQTGPDLTQTNPTLINTTRNYNLGPTGLRGWIYIPYPGGDAQNNIAILNRMTAFAPFQVLVTSVGTNTPAAGIIQTNDILLGVNTGSNNLPVPLFTNDTRRAIGFAIGAAEAGDGWMNFKIWRAGVTNDVSIQLPLRGLGYSATAPYNCPKSAVVLSNAVNVLLTRSLNMSSPADAIMGLAMLASGNTNFLPKLQTYARSMPMGQPIFSSWEYGYKGVFLAEYYFKTGDTNILPVLNSLLITMANGTDRYGTICHGPGFNNADGSPNGTAGGYGPVNAVGITVNLAFVLGQKALVAAGMPVNPVIPAAINRGTNFFGWFVQKGEIPYGEHLPWVAGGHYSNGKLSQAALLFALTGDRPVETEYWTRMTLAGYLAREFGHTGQALNYIWETLGANVAGTNALAAYVSQIQWHLDLERRADGSFAYDGAEQYGPTGCPDYWTLGFGNTYCGEDPTAYYVLTYALPLQQIYVTGKNANPANFLSADKVTNAIAAAWIPSACANFTTNQLIAALSEFDPTVRCWSALELGKRAGVTAASLTNLVNSTNAWTRGAACMALGVLKEPVGFPSLIQCLNDSDTSVRAYAAIALKRCGSAITNYIPIILAAYINTATDPTVINWNDPWQGANGVLGEVLFGGSALSQVQSSDELTAFTANADRNLLHPALKIALKQPESTARGEAAIFINQSLPLTDIQALVLDLIQCATTPVMANPMGRSEGRRNSIQALGKYYGAEAIPVAMAMVNPPWNALNQGDNPEIDSPAAALNVLVTYGDSVRYLLPTLNNYVSTWGANDYRFPELVSAINAIIPATSSPAITNYFPVANNIVVATTNTVAVTLTGFSCRTNSVTFQNVTAPAHGLLTGTLPNLTYTPTPGYSGADYFTFQVADQLTNSSPATVSIIVGAAGAGAKGYYYDNSDFTNLKFSRIDPQINFDWGTGSPSNTIAADTFSVRWSGALLAPESGYYKFSTLNSDGVRLYVNGTLLIDDWQNQSRNWTDGSSIYLTAGQQYVVQMDYYKNTGDAVAKLKWTGPSFAGSNGVPIAKEWLFDITGVTNLPLFAYPQNVVLAQNANAAITLFGSANATSYQIVTPPAHGALTGTPPLVTYTPATNYAGGDSFTFSVSNSVGTSTPATVSINLLAGQPVSFNWNTAADGLWSVGANWTNNVAPAATGQPFYTLNFNPAGTYTATSDLNNGFLLNQLNFAAGSGALTLAGNSLALTNNGTALSQINQNSGAAVVIGNNVALGTNTTIGGTGAGGLTLNGALSGAGSLTMLNPGILTLNAASTHSGGVIVSNGTFTLGNQNGLGTGPVTLAGGTTFQTANFEGNYASGALPNAFILSGGNVTLNINFNNYKDIWLANTVSGAGGFTVLGTGAYQRTLTLAASNTFSGGVRILDNDKVAITTVNSLGTGALSLGNASGGTLVTYANLSAGQVTNAINLAWGANLTVDTANGNLNLSGTITNTGGLTKISGNNLTLSGLNTYTGTTTISTGTLSVNTIKNFSSACALGQPTNGAIQLGSGANTGTLVYIGTGDTANRTFQIGDTTVGNTGGGTINNNGSGALTFTAANFNPMIAYVITNRTLTLGGSYAAGTNQIQGIIQDNVPGVAKISLTKNADASIWALSGANTYSGATAVNGGTLKLTGGSLGNTAVTLSGTSTFAVQPGSATTITLGNASGGGATGGTLTLAGTSTFDMTDGAVSTFNIVGNATTPPTALTAANGATWKFDLGNADSDHVVLYKSALAGTGAANLAAGNVTISTAGATSLTAGNYALISAASGISTSGWTFTGGGTNQLVSVGGNSYLLTLPATSTALTLNVATTTATKLGFTTQPTSALAGLTLGQQPVVQIQDASGTGVPLANVGITLSGVLGLTGTVTVLTDVTGKATFSGLSVSTAGTNLQMTASSGGLTSVNSSPFNILTTATYTQTNSGGIWSAGMNWNSGVVAVGSGNTANFNTVDNTADNTVRLDFPVTLGNLIFGDTDANTAAAWTLNNNGNSTNTLTLASGTPAITVNALGAGKSATISAIIAGSTPWSKLGIGTLTLSGTNTYTAATTVSNGALQISSPYFNIGRTTTIASGAVLDLRNSANALTNQFPVSLINGAGTFRLSGNTIVNQFSGGTPNQRRLTISMSAGGLIDLQDTAQLVNGGWQNIVWTANQASLNIAAAAKFDIWDGNPVFVDALTGSGTVDKGFAGSHTLNVGVAGGSGTFSGTIKNTTGTLLLTKAGAGTQTLSGTNTYTGPTTVNGGTLLINGNSSAVNNTVTVTNGAAFGGTGTIGGVVRYQSGSLAAFTISNSMTFTNTVFMTNVTVGVSMPVGLGNGVYVLATNTQAAPTVIGGLTFATNSGSLGAGGFGAVSVSGKTLVLTVSGASSATPAKFSSIGVSGTTLGLVVTNGVPGSMWTLLQSTNLSTPISQWQTNRTGIYDGSGNFSTNIPNAATNRITFYLLK